MKIQIHRLRHEIYTMHLLILMRYIDCEICLLGAQRRICPTLSMATVSVYSYLGSELLHS